MNHLFFLSSNNFKPQNNTSLDLLLNDFNYIMNESKTIIASGKYVINDNDKLNWWKSRKDLDVYFANYLHTIEQICFSCWKGIFIAQDINMEIKSYKKALINELYNYILQLCPNKAKSFISINYIKILFNGFNHITYDQFKYGIAWLFGWYYECISIDQDYQFKAIQIKKLKDIYNLFIINYKKYEIYQQQFKNNNDKSSIILCLSKEIQCIPFENLPIAQLQSISRAPNINFIISQYITLNNRPNKVYNALNTYYIVNPGNDIPRTQQIFESKFNNEKTWSGLIATKPTHQLMNKILSESDIYIYCGHGSGSKYYSTDLISRTSINSIVILMGCSSGLLKSNIYDEYEANGVALSYLAAGATCVIANLWDVTDKDIDKFSDHMLQSIAYTNDQNINKKNNIVQAMNEARNSCKLRYLNGAATVCYGIPVNIVKK